MLLLILLLLFYEFEFVFVVVGWLLLLGGNPIVNLLLLSLSFVLLLLLAWENVEAIQCHSVESNVVLEGMQGLLVLFVSGIVSPSVVL